MSIKNQISRASWYLAYGSAIVGSSISIIIFRDIEKSEFISLQSISGAVYLFTGAAFLTGLFLTSNLMLSNIGAGSNRKDRYNNLPSKRARYGITILAFLSPALTALILGKVDLAITSLLLWPMLLPLIFLIGMLAAMLIAICLFAVRSIVSTTPKVFNSELKGYDRLLAGSLVVLLFGTIGMVGSIVAVQVPIQDWGGRSGRLLVGKIIGVLIWPNNPIGADSISVRDIEMLRAISWVFRISLLMIIQYPFLEFYTSKKRN